MSPDVLRSVSGRIRPYQADTTLIRRISNIPDACLMPQPDTRPVHAVRDCDVVVADYVNDKVIVPDKMLAHLYVRI